MSYFSSLPYLTQDLPGFVGILKAVPEDFLVEEIPLYEPLGDGEITFVFLEKRGENSEEVAKKIAELLSIPRQEVRFAGRKDKHAVTRQTFSIRTSLSEKKIQKILGDYWKVFWVKRHSHHLKPGHLLGNRFTILLRDICLPSKEVLEAIGNRLRKVGMINYYGPQRFGKKWENLYKARKIFQGWRTAKPRMRLYLSAWQSFWFNEYLKERVQRGMFTLFLGDIAKKHDTGGMFLVEQERERERWEKREITFTGPILGYRVWSAEGKPGELEQEILQRSGVSEERLRSLHLKGSRRPGRVLVSDLEVELRGKDLLLRFTLPKGSYATMLVREFQKGGVEG